MGEDAKRKLYSHAADAENADNGGFGPLVHAQVPNQRHWEKTDDQIGDGGTDTIEVCDRNERVLVDAGPVAGE